MLVVLSAWPCSQAPPQLFGCIICHTLCGRKCGKNLLSVLVNKVLACSKIGKACLAIAIHGEVLLLASELCMPSSDKC